MSVKTLTNRFHLRTKNGSDNTRYKLPEVGEIILPDESNKVIANWPSNNLHNTCVVKIKKDDSG